MKIKKWKVVIITSFIFTTFLFSFTENLTSAKNKKAQPVTVDGDKVEYFREQKKVVAEGNVKATYKDMKLYCDKATVLTDKKVVYAEGNVKLIHQRGIFRGKKVKYNFKTKKAQVKNISMENVGPWYGKGKKGKKYSKHSYLVKDGYITTCNYENPHYKIESNEIKIYLGKKVVAKNIVMKVGNVPIMYLPRYTRSLKDERSIVRIVPGHSSDWGYYLLTSWRYNFSPIGNGRIHLDYRELKGLAQGFDLNYNQLGNGKLRFYYTHEHDKVPPDNTPSDTWKERYRVQLRHKANFDNNSLRLEYHKMADEDFIEDYFYEEYKQDQQPTSYLSLIHTEPHYTLSLLAKKRVNHFFKVTERLPELKFDLRKQKIKNTPFYFKNKTSFSNLAKKFANSSQEDFDTIRFDTFNKISYPFRAAQLKLKPWTALRETFYSKVSDKEDEEIRGVFYGGIDISSKLFKIYDVKTDVFNINRLRHIITPTLEYKYIPEPTIPSSQLYNFDSIDNITRTNIVTLGLENRFQTKRKKGNSYSTKDLGYLRTTIDYNYKPENGSNWEDLKADLELNPYNWLRFESDAKYNPRTKDIEEFNFDSVYKKEDYEIGLGHRYQQNVSSQVTAQFKYYINNDKKWTKRWIVDTYLRYEDETSNWEEFQLKLTKDLHCWLADLVYNYKEKSSTESEDNHTFYIVFRLKAYPKIPFKLFETSYEEPKPEE